MNDFPRKTLEDYIKNNVRNEQVKSTIKIYYSESRPSDGVVGAGIVGFEYLRGEI